MKITTTHALPWRIAASLLAVIMLVSAVPLAAAAPQVETLADAQVLSVGNTLSLTETARSMDFNEDWSFALNPTGTDSALSAAGFDDSQWRGLSLPHDWSIEQDFTNQVSSEIGHLPGGTGWYRKSFTLPAELDGKRINIDFDGVYMDSHIWVNGEKVGNYPNGYLPFSFDITDYVTCDGKTENVIAVKVTNITGANNISNQSSRWYSGSGIYRDVHMTVTDPVHVAQYGTAIYTPYIATEASSGNITVNVTTTVENETDAEASVQVRSTILNYADGSQFQEPVTSDAVTITAGGKADVAQTMTAVNPKLWSTDSPNLYKMKTEVLVNGAVTDTYETRFGFTWSEFFTVTEAEILGYAFALNGEGMKLNGVCMHHDQGALGAVDNADAIERQMRIMKEMGVNAIRVTHNPASPDLMRICDELGLMVIEEAFDTWYGGKKNYDYHRFFEQACTYPGVDSSTTWAQFDLQQMIRCDRNSPSIIAWSLGNEIGETSSQKGLTTVQNLVSWAKEIDTTHPVTMGEDKFRMNRGTDSDWFIKVADCLDVVGMNYAEDNYDYYKSLRPNWKIYGSETSSAIKSRGYYSDPGKNAGAQYINGVQLSSYDNLAVGWGKTATNSWIPDRDREWIGGQFIWTGFDYIGEPTPFNQSYDAKSKSSYFGIVDTAGFPKDDYYLYQSQWLDVETDPMVHIFPHWNWEDESLRNLVTTNGTIPVRVYSNAPTVELVVTRPDGTESERSEKSFYTLANGYQQQSENSNRLYLQWDLEWNYAVGTTITAYAKNDAGEIIATDTVVTAGNPAQIGLTADKSVIDADGYSLSYITVEIQDADGNVMPTAMNEVNFRISGNGTIVGVDNGDPASWERYKDTNGQWKRSAFNGKAVVIVQSTKEAGSFTLTAQSAGLTSDSVTVYTTASDTTDDTILGYEVTSLMVNAGVVPTQDQLPQMVNAVYANGTKEEMAVTWTLPGEDAFAQPAEVTINGTVTKTGASVSMLITVRDSVGVQPISVVTAKGEIPQLPTTVTVVWSDGSSETKNVTWTQITADQVDEVGTFVVKSASVEGTDFVAEAYIRVVEQAVEQNIALSSNGTTVATSYQEGVHYPAHLIDGNKTSENGWGNWESTNRKQDTATLTFSQAYTIGKVNVWINTLNGKTWQKPDEITIEYWNGTDWAPVANQSKNTGFAGWSNPSDSYSGNVITFDAVTTSKLRFTFKVNAYTNGNNMMKIMEIEAFATVLPFETNAALSDLQVNGETVEGFAANVTGYLVETDYASATPVVTAKAAGNATVFVRQALNNNGTAVVTVTSEDGRTTRDYTIQFVRKAPGLDTVTVNVASSVQQDAVVDLSATGTLQDKTTVSSADYTTSYQVTNGTGYAEVQNGQLYAYEAGTVELTATMTYQGKQVTSAPVTVTITKNTADKWVTSFDAVNVRTAPKTAPELPSQVTAHFNTGLSRKVDVQWAELPESQYAEMNTFTVLGTVDLSGIVTVEKDLQPTATVMVVDAVAAENVAMAVPEGFPPELPAETTVYFSDGTSDILPVSWNEDGTTFEGITTYSGTVTYSGKEIPVTATVRAGESTKSANYVIVRNGYDLPVGLASYTNDTKVEATSTDSTANLNDGNTSFVLDGKRIWCNWKRNGGQNTTDWVSVTIANEGVPVTKTVNSIRVGFMDEKGVAGSIDLPTAYYVEYYTGPIDYDIDLMDTGHVGTWENSPLNDPDNWTEVTYVGSKPAPAQDAMTEVTFEPVTTHLIRVRMDATSGYCLGVNELEVYGEIASENNAFDVSSIALDDKNILGEFENGIYTVTLKAGEPFPAVTAAASSNAAVTVVPATEQNPVATVRIVPESGAETAIQTYTIRFEREDEPEPMKYAITIGEMTNGTVTADKTEAAEGETVTLTVKPAEGYRLVAGSLKYNETAVTGNTFTMPAGAVTITAAFEEIPAVVVKHTITLDPNGGTISVKTIEVEDGKTTVLPTPYRAGSYRFLGWFDEDGNQVTSATPITQDMTLTARWQYTGGSSKPTEPSKPAEPTEPEKVSYYDVSVGDWYYEAVSYVSEHGLMTGVGSGKFNPDGAVTRAMVWTVLARMAGEDTDGGATWYSKAQAWAMETGVSDGTNPTGSITREQLAAMLYRYEGSPAVSGNLNAYPDANTVSDWAKDAMVWATEEGIINGMGGYLKPQDGATRAQLAAMLMRFEQSK